MKLPPILLALLVTCLPLVVAKISTCKNTFHCNCSPKDGGLEYLCPRIDNTDKQLIVDVTPSKTNYNLRVTCNGYNETEFDYFPVIREINVTKKIQAFELKQCPLSNESFAKFLPSSYTKLLKRITFQQGESVKKGLKRAHFEDLTSVEYLQLESSELTWLPDDVFAELPNLRWLFLNENNLGYLSQELFKSIPNLDRLEVFRNNISRLEAGVFRHVPNIKLLNLHGNPLAMLDEGVFDDVPKLNYLDLKDAKLSHLDKGIFQKLTQLVQIDLSSNHFVTLPKELFAKNKALEKICLRGGFNGTSADIPAGLFANLPSLVEIDLDGNNFTSLPDGLFRGTDKLVKLSLTYNSLKTLSGRIFNDLTSLRELDLSSNRLEALDAELFQSLKKLTTLKLRSNRLTDLNSDIFLGLTSLQELDLSRNFFVDFENNVFGNVPNLETLDVSFNKLDLGDPGRSSAFQSCGRLKNLFLRNNSITTIYDDWRLSTTLQNLDLRENKIVAVNVNQMIFLSHSYPKQVNLNGNNLTTVLLEELEMHIKMQCETPPCKEDVTIEQERNTIFLLPNNTVHCDCNAYHLAKYFQRQMFAPVYKYLTLKPDTMVCAGPASLRGVSLRDVDVFQLQCPIEKVTSRNKTGCPTGCVCSFRPVDDTIVVNCEGLGMNVLPSQLPPMGGFRRCELLLANNSLESLDGLRELLAFENISKLSVSGNRIRSLENVQLPKGLKILELDNNELTSMDKKTIQTLNETTSLTEISLEKNPWQCNCDTKYLLNFIRVHIGKVHNSSAILCKDTGHPIVELSIDDLCETSLTIIVTCISLAVFGLLSGAVVALYYIYEHEIKVWMFAHKICLWLVTEKEMDKDKKYDAFVSFSSIDQKFVDEHLIPQLEKTGDHQYKLCIHYRDFEVGEFIPKQIVHAVENSRRTIIVLTPNFLNSVWALMEFRTAHLKAIKERCARIIVILLDDVNVEKLDPELKTYITMNTYVKWGDPLFWQKLRYALPHPQVYYKQKKSNVVPFSESEFVKQHKMFNLNGLVKGKV